jgi:hypothetical protein
MIIRTDHYLCTFPTLKGVCLTYVGILPSHPQYNDLYDVCLLQKGWCLNRLLTVPDNTRIKRSAFSWQQVEQRNRGTIAASVSAVVANEGYVCETSRSAH